MGNRKKNCFFNKLAATTFLALFLCPRGMCECLKCSRKVLERKIVHLEVTPLSFSIISIRQSRYMVHGVFLLNFTQTANPEQKTSKRLLTIEVLLNSVSKVKSITTHKRNPPS